MAVSDAVNLAVTAAEVHPVYFVNADIYPVWVLGLYVSVLSK